MLFVREILAFVKFRQSRIFVLIENQCVGRLNSQEFANKRMKTKIKRKQLNRKIIRFCIANWFMQTIIGWCRATKSNNRVCWICDCITISFIAFRSFLLFVRCHFSISFMQHDESMKMFSCLHRHNNIISDWKMRVRFACFCIGDLFCEQTLCIEMGALICRLNE